MSFFWRFVVFLLLCFQLEGASTSRYLAVVICPEASISREQTPSELADRHLKQDVRSMFQIKQTITNGTNYSHIETRLNHSLFAAYETVDSLSIIIEGDFNQKQVIVFGSLAIRYEQFVATWSSMLGNRRLWLWLIGPGSHKWVYRCIEAYDFDMFELTAYEDGRWLYLGAEQNPLISTDFQLKVSIENRMEAQTKVTIYSIKDHQFANLSIINIGNVTRLYQNASTNQTFLECKISQWVMFGVMTKSDPYITQIYLRYWHRTMKINSTTIILRRDRSQAVAHNFRINSFYLGGVDENENFHGMGCFRTTELKTVGMFFHGLLNGKGASVYYSTAASRAQKQQLFQLFRMRNYLSTAVAKGTAYRGSYVNHHKSRGCMRKAVEFALGYFRFESNQSLLIYRKWGMARVYRITQGRLVSAETGFFEKSIEIHGRVQHQTYEFRGRFNPQHEQPELGTYHYYNGTLYFGRHQYGGQMELSLSFNSTNFYFGGYYDTSITTYACEIRKGSYYKGQVLKLLKHGYGQQTFGAKKWREGIFYEGEFVKGIQYDDGVITEGQVVGNNHVESTLIIDKRSILKGPSDNQHEHLLRTNENQVQIADQKHHLGEEFIIEQANVS